jgi:hypothetical protein
MEILAPDPGRTAVAGFEHDRGAARTAAFQVDVPAAANIDEAGEITPRGR